MALLKPASTASLGPLRVAWLRTGISWCLTWPNTGSIRFSFGEYGGRKHRQIPSSASPWRAARITLLVWKLVLSSTTTRRAFDHGRALRNPIRSCELQVRSAVNNTSSRGLGPKGRQAARAATRRPGGASYQINFRWPGRPQLEPTGSVGEKAHSSR